MWEHAWRPAENIGLENRGFFAMTSRVKDDSANRGVALDLDGILLDGMRFHIEAWHKAFVGYDVELAARDLYLLEGVKTREVVDRLAALYELDLSLADRDAIARQKKDTYQAIFEPVPLRGARELLDTCHDAGYRIAIVTGTVALSANRTLQKLDRTHYVDNIISADLHIAGKPDPAPFREAVARLEVDREMCLGVDNAPAGVESATGAGLPCAGVATYLPPTDLVGADRVFDNISTFTAWLNAERKQSGGIGPWRL